MPHIVETHVFHTYRFQDFVMGPADVLGRPEPISSLVELDVKKYGEIVSCSSHQGLLLPDLEGVDMVERQIDIARQKGGISFRENTL